ncbi:MAG: energy-coupling factor transporter ATPase [Anaerolineales bacterium]
MSALIEIENLSFQYPVGGAQPIQALRGISLRIENGEYVALIGANGSGKTTLARHLNALLLPSVGSVRVNGMDTRDPRHRQRIRSIVGMVMQYPEDQIVATGVEEDVAFGPENLGLPVSEIRRRIEESLKAVGMWELRHRPPYLLSAGQIQRVALAGILALRPRCIVFDEATSMLDPLGRRTVLSLIDQLHREGITIITVTHFMNEAARAGRVVVLHQGQVVMDDVPEKVFSHVQELEEIGLGLPATVQTARALRAVLLDLPDRLLRVDDLIQALPTYPGGRAVKAELSSPKSISPLGQPALVEVHGLEHTYLLDTPLAQRALEGVNFYVSDGSAHGILGSTGSGKSTLLQHLNGLLLPQSGEVRVGNFLLHHRDTDLQAVRCFAGLVFQFPETQFFEQYVGDEIAYGLRLLKRTKERIRADVRWAMEIVGLDFERYKDRLTFTLSGGESRKVALASILALRPRLLLLDEPLAGLDPLSRHDLLIKLKGLQREGMTVILSSHHMEEVAELTDELTVFHQGRDVLRGGVREVFDRVDELRTLGLEPPVAVRVAAALRQRGWVLPPGLIRPQELADQVGRLQVGFHHESV